MEKNTASAAPMVLSGISEVTAAFSQHGIGKNRKNESQGFAFRGIDDVLDRMSKHLCEANLVIVPQVTNREVHERINQRGNALFYVVLTVDYTIYSTVDGSSVTVRTVGEAMDSGDKATNKALSVAYKYMAFQTFSIPISDDPDQQTHVVAPQKKSAPQTNRSVKTLGETEAATITKLIGEAEQDAEALFGAYGVSKVEEIPMTKFKEIVDRLQSKIKEKVK